MEFGEIKHVTAGHTYTPRKQNSSDRKCWEKPRMIPSRATKPKMTKLSVPTER